MTHISWLKQHSLPAFGLILMVMILSGYFGLKIFNMQDITITLHNGQQATSWDIFLLEGVVYAIGGAFIHCVVLMVLFVGRVPFRWGLMMAMLLLFGAPFLYVLSYPMVQYFEGRDDYGLLSGTPQIVILLVCWGLTLAFGNILPRFRVVLVRIDSDCKSPCPRCGYELYGCRNSECPECGWQFPEYLSAGEF